MKKIFSTSKDVKLSIAKPIPTKVLTTGKIKPKGFDFDAMAKIPGVIDRSAEPKTIATTHDGLDEFVAEKVKVDVKVVPPAEPVPVPVCESKPAEAAAKPKKPAKKKKTAKKKAD